MTHLSLLPVIQLQDSQISISDDDEKHESRVHSGERGHEVIVGVRIDSII